MELFDPKNTREGWKKVSKLTMPAGVSEHCAVTMDGRQGKEMVVIGGRGRESKALKLNIRNNRCGCKISAETSAKSVQMVLTKQTQYWAQEPRVFEGKVGVLSVLRSNILQVTLNGRPGIIVSGGSNPEEANLTSVEFFDAKTGFWYNMPSLNRGRKGHAMTINKGKLLVGSYLYESCRSFLF